MLLLLLLLLLLPLPLPRLLFLSLLSTCFVYSIPPSFSRYCRKYIFYFLRTDS